MIFTAKGYSQYYFRGQNSSALHWKQIRTEHFQLIYTDTFELKAQYTANLLSRVYEKANSTLKVKPRKITIILQNDLVEANGFVTLAPWRSEFFTTPPQDDEGLEWMSLLAVHEYRHVVQISKYFQGMTRVLYWLLGEQGVGLVIGATTPLWFFEGDAVGFETFSTGYGRGRLPSFNMQSRAQLLQLGAFNYDKASFGSYKHMIPSRYPFGYHMTSYVKEKYGSTVWDSVLNRIAKFPLQPFPFSSSLKHYTGKTTSEMYQDMVQYQQEKWNRIMEINEKEYTDFLVLNDTNRRTFTNYSFPIQTFKGTLAVKEGFGDVSQVVLINGYKERCLSKMGVHDKNSFHANEKYAAWVEEFPDLRWEYRSFSDIILFDLEKEKRIRFTEKERVFSPNLSKDNHIVAVSLSKANIPSLVFYNIDSNKCYLTKEFPEMDMLYFPVWGKHNDIYFVAKKNGYQHLLRWDMEMNIVDEILSDLPFVISHLAMGNDAVYFHSSQNGIDNIYKVKLNMRQAIQITASRFGAFYPSVNSDGELFYSEYTAKGMNAVVLKRKYPAFKVPSTSFVSQGLLLYSNALQDEKKVNFSHDNFVHFESTKYQKWKHLFNIHSWGPVSINADSREAALGFSLLSQNKLSTLLTSYNYTYNIQQFTQTNSVKVQYMAFFPKFSLEGTTQRVDNISIDDSTVVSLNRQMISGDVSLELNLTRGYFQKFVYTTLRYGYTYLNRSDGKQGRGDVVDAQITLTGVTRKAKRDLLARWGYVATAWSRYPVVKQPFISNSIYTSLKLFSPGIAKHHGIQYWAEWQNSSSSGIYPNNLVELPRGYINVNGQYYYNNILSGKVDYKFPLCYPDVRLGWLTYIQRIKMGFHYDYANLIDLDGNTQILQSYGAEIRADMNFLRYSYLFDVGYRVSVYQENNSMYFYPQLLVSVGFY